VLSALLSREMWVFRHRILVFGKSELVLGTGPSSSAGGRGRETREWNRAGLVARQMTLAKPKTLRVGLTASVAYLFVAALTDI